MHAPDSANVVQVLYSETMDDSIDQGFSFNYAVGDVTTPLPASPIMILIGLSSIGLLGWRRKRKAQAVA
jgi:hypothetical protein